MRSGTTTAADGGDGYILTTTCTRFMRPIPLLLLLFAPFFLSVSPRRVRKTQGFLLLYLIFVIFFFFLCFRQKAKTTRATIYRAIHYVLYTPACRPIIPGRSTRNTAPVYRNHGFVDKFFAPRRPDSTSV